MKDIKELSLKELRNYFISLNEPQYRASEVFREIYKNKAEDFNKITTLPKELRAILTKSFYIYSFSKVSEIKTEDGTVKFLFKLKDSLLIETVLIKEKNKFGTLRNTVCISTQVGCMLGCKFCATGKMGFIRNLSTGEIIEQFMHIDKSEPLNNIVFMGMGEPLLNYENVKKAIEILSDENGRNFGRRKIVISTVGIIDKIYKITDEINSVKLAISLHAPTQSKRDAIMERTKSFTMSKLKESLKYYIKETGNTVTIEYLLIKDFNDGKDDAKKLIKYLEGLKFVKVNLIHLNLIPNIPLEPSEREIEFQKFLIKNGVRATLRKSKGTEISAACGQLATKI
jgi:23S rRNA (adenine2503-C2)-methyltransferase